jgi:hypothetical protein
LKGNFTKLNFYAEDQNEKELTIAAHVAGGAARLLLVRVIVLNRL